MREQIIAGLEAIEREKGVCILYACEAGSRAWGFASPDSDYDIRFIFAYPQDRYLRLDDPRDVIERMDGDLDYAGWDIRKTLRLLRNTNPALLEWLSSPIVYRSDGVLREELADLSRRYHAPIAVHWHYLKMAKGNYVQYIKNPAERGENVLTKKYLYVANPLLKLLYFHAHHTLPPLPFQEALDGVELVPSVREALLELVELKRSGMELGKGPASPTLNVWMESEMAHLQKAEPTATKYPELTGLLNKVLMGVLSIS